MSALAGSKKAFINMCGINGFLLVSAEPPDVLTQQVSRMSAAISHRGPDDLGTWVDNFGTIAFAHRRLSIVDLSAQGHQPMESHRRRYVMVFNGEIYNHLDLREQLERSAQPPPWRGHADTETLLACFDAWGIEATVRKCIGMFAFAVWDQRECTLTLGRDRLGEKPLYYGWQGSGNAAVFLFGSELKALRAHPAFGAQVNHDALGLYLRHMAVPGAHSIYKGIHKLLPGSLLTVSRQTPQPSVRTYWSGSEVAERGVAQPFSGTANDAVDALEWLLKDAVRQQMMADVPLGAFLSGGVDSSTLVALMQAQSSRAVKTFSIGFHEDAYNEARYAKAVAKHLGTDHTELYVTPQQAMDVIPRLASLYDEPFADSSQIPTYLVSQLARQQVTVSLSGDGGDELFSGYNRYIFTESLWRKISKMPVGLRRALAWSVTRCSPERLSRLASVLPGRALWANVGDKLHKGAEVITSRSVEDLYLNMVSTWNDPAAVVIGAREPATLLTGLSPPLKGLSAVERMMALDLLTYLPDDILTKVDRAAMGVSLETRVPMLDHRVVEFAWSLPLQYKLRPEGKGHISKWALRQVLYRYVPQALIDRPKMGFGVPIDSWLRGPLRDWAEDLLSEDRLKRDGYFKPFPVRLKWAEHLSGRRNWQSQLWSVLMFQAWLAEQ